jgi:hypothetical protein
VEGADNFDRPDVPPPPPAAGREGREETRRQVLRDFTADVRRWLAEDSSPVGQFIFAHISRQLDVVGSAPYTCWFEEVGRRWGFDPDVTLAAIAGSDVARATPFSATARAHFGSTQERVQALAAQGDLRFGRAFPTYTGLENLYMHAEAGRHYTRTELERRAAALLDPQGAGRLAREVSDAILGHDSFNAGFGRHKLKPLLAGKYQEPVEAFDYPTSKTPAGFLVQVVDRLEGCEPPTMLRYVTEGVTQRQEPISQAIQTGLIDNTRFLGEVHDLLVRDARQVLPPAQAQVFLESRAMQDFAQGLNRLPAILGLLGSPPSPDADGFYRLSRGTGRVRLDSLEVFAEHFLAACGSAG